MADRRVYTFSELFDLFTAKFSTLTNLVDDFNIGSALRAFGQAIVFFVNFMQVQVDVAFKSFRVKTAEGEDLDNRVGDWQLTRYEETEAYGDVVFIRDTVAEEDFIIPAGTVVSTQEDVYGNTLDFALDSDLTMVSGGLTATGTVTCLTVGILGNVQANKITNMKETIDGVDSINNPSAFSTGSETESDELLRKRVVLKVIGTQTSNYSSILNAAYSVPGVTYAKVSNNNPSSGEFTVYFSTYNGTVATELRTRVKTAVDAVAPFCIVPNYAIPTVQNVVVSLNLSMDSIVQASASSGEVVSGAINAIYDFIQLNNENTLKISDIIVNAKRIEFVTDITDVLIDGAATNLTVSDFEVIKIANANNISVTVV